jgi:hypothetical protein
MEFNIYDVTEEFKIAKQLSAIILLVFTHKKANQSCEKNKTSEKRYTLLMAILIF